MLLLINTLFLEIPDLSNINIFGYVCHYLYDILSPLRLYFARLRGILDDALLVAAHLLKNANFPCNLFMLLSFSEYNTFHMRRQLR